MLKNWYYSKASRVMQTARVWRRKAEAKHMSYTSIPTSSQRYRFVALNEMGRLLVER